MLEKKRARTRDRPPFFVVSEAQTTMASSRAVMRAQSAPMEYPPPDHLDLLLRVIPPFACGKVQRKLKRE